MLTHDGRVVAPVPSPFPSDLAVLSVQSQEPGTFDRGFDEDQPVIGKGRTGRAGSVVALSTGLLPTSFAIVAEREYSIRSEKRVNAPIVAGRRVGRVAMSRQLRFREIFVRIVVLAFFRSLPFDPTRFQIDTDEVFCERPHAAFLVVLLRPFESRETSHIDIKSPNDWR